MYKSLERVIKEVAGGIAKKSVYTSLEHSIRNVMEKRERVEHDPNDQVVVGTYRTKNFEQSSEAQKLYSALPKSINPGDAEKSAILHDQLFDLHKEVLTKKRSTKADITDASDLIKKIQHLASKMNLEKEHGYLDRVINDFNTHLDTSGNVFDSDMMDVSKINNRFGTIPKDETKEIQDNDIDNTKFLITRNLKAQRKLKIIDND